MDTEDIVVVGVLGLVAFLLFKPAAAATTTQPPSGTSSGWLGQLLGGIPGIVSAAGGLFSTSGNSSNSNGPLLVVPNSIGTTDTTYSGTQLGNGNP